MKSIEKDRLVVSVRIGPKGQITVPVEARKMFGLQEGDTLMFMGDKERGMALVKADEFYKLMGGFPKDESD